MLNITGAFLFMATGLISVTFAIAIYIFNPYDLIFKWKLKFEKDGEVYNLWAKPPVDLYLKIFLFNITNSEDFLAGKDKQLRVKEVGPFVYRELLSHENITFNSNGTVSTTPRHPLVWQEELSEGNKEDDQLILPNIALLSIAQVAAEKSYFFRLPINILIRQTDSQPLVRMTAREFMFGYESPLTTLGYHVLPNWISFEKVGLIDRMYDFEGDYETIFSGETDPSMSGLYDTYKGSQNLPQWDGDHCSRVTGASDGTKFKSFMAPNETILFFRKSMCTVKRMVQQGEPTEVSGLTAQKFVFEENALDNGAIEEKNKCYCRQGKCLPVGLIDVTDCYYGFPIALSYPHFLDADPNLSTNIVGLKPNRTEHESFFIIQPTSGLPLRCSMRFQINLAMKDVSSMSHVEQFSHLTIPMLWFDITFHELPPALKNRFHLYLNVLPVLDNLLFYGSAIGGVLLLLFAVTKASVGMSGSLTSPTRKISLQRTYDFRSTKVYAPCEEKRHPSDCHELTMPSTNDVVPTSVFDLENEIPLSDTDELELLHDERDSGHGTNCSNASEDCTITIPQEERKNSPKPLCHQNSNFTLSIVR
ncbi:scavenger receptor class B member 1 isoform X2 [Lutzomyia longipalpis]|uniref:scavenger receptor class B member 1 isoform X2 n=1 Tax=Lutzomyia longipalpis TaxID=7200 RepID=UPI00248408CB|nr:scavenger receptor class B member 1 isoform X2 [Lutzomyia longipalpis]